jgi:uncharacterized protein YbjT (DUF2867 family)
MRIIVIGGTGLIGSKLLPLLIQHGHDAVPGSLETGLNTITGEGLAGLLKDANVVVDVSNSPSFEDRPAMDFFTTSTHNLLSYEKEAGVMHHVALSVVGTERLQESGYLRAKMAQENLIRDSSMPHSIVHATQFFEFFRAIANGATAGDAVHLSHALIQPMAAEEVAAALARVAMAPPLNDTIEVAGPQAFHLDEFIRMGLEAAGDTRRVVADPQARYFGALLDERTLLPEASARLGEISFESWLQADLQSSKAA